MWCGTRSTNRVTYLVQHAQLARGMVNCGFHMQILHATRPPNGRQLMEVGCKEHRTSHMLHQMLADRPRQPKAVIRGGAPTQLVDDDQGLRSGSLCTEY